MDFDNQRDLGFQPTLAQIGQSFIIVAASCLFLRREAKLKNHNSAPLFALTSLGLIENRRVGASSAWARESQSNVPTRTSPTTAGWKQKFVFYDLIKMNPSVLNSGDGCEPKNTTIPI